MDNRARLAPLFALAALPFLLGAASWWETPYSLTRKGNKAYEKQDFEAALRSYEDAAALRPGEPAPAFNRGVALQGLNSPDEALKQYGELLRSLGTQDTPESRRLREALHYNAGNALFAKGDYVSALGAYREALRLDPADMDAKRNYELALKRMQESQDKSDGDGDSEDKDESKEQSGQQPKPQPQEQEPQRQAGQGLSKEEAERLMQMLQQYEKDALKNFEEKQRAAAPAPGGRDW